MQIRLEWTGGSTFPVRTPSGASVLLDREAAAGPSPMEALLASLAGCMAIDVVLILERMRMLPTRLEASVSGDRAEEHPRRFNRIRLEFTAFGGAVAADRLERAVQLSFEKYCSVLHSLGKDLEYDWSATVAEGNA